MPKKSWTRQKDLLKHKLPTLSDVIRVAYTAKTRPSRQLLYVLSYLTAGRVTEIINIEAGDIEKRTVSGYECLVIDMINEKNRRRKRKEIPLRFDKEPELLNMVWAHREMSVHGRLFGFKTRQRAWQILRELEVNPHFLRHMRISHLIKYYGMDPNYVQLIAGWSSLKPLEFYKHLYTGDIVKAYD